LPLEEKENNLSEALKELLKFVPADKLRKSILEVYFNYVGEANYLHHDFKEISSDIYFLLKFIEKAEKLEKEIQK